MPQVPYSSALEVTSRDAPISPIRVDTPADAFGASLGRALGQSASIIGEASDEVFKRAMAMQQLENEAKSREAQANYMQSQGQLHAEFSAKQGSEAGPQALQDYTDKSKALRIQFRDGLESPAAQKMFDSDSLGFLGRNIFNAAGHSAGQMKSYSLATSKAVMDNNANVALQNPNDNLQFEASLKAQKALALQHAQDSGFAPGTPGSDSIVAKEVSNLTASRILGSARTNPAQANAWFQSALKDGSLRGQDIARVQNTIQSQTLSMLPKHINDGINDGSSLILGKGIVSPDQARAGIKNAEGGGYDLQGPVVAKGQYAGQRALGAYQVMPGNLPSWLREAGMPQMTPAQFLANPQAQDQLFDKRFGAYMQKYGSANRAASAWFTGNPDAPATAGDGYHTAPEYLAKFNAGLAGAVPLAARVQAARTEAARLGQGVPGVEDAAEARVIATYRQDEAIKKTQTADTWNVINSAIVGTQGQAPTTIDQLRQDPKVAQAIDSLPPKDVIKLQTQLRAVSAHDNDPSPERDQNFSRLTGMSQNNPDAFREVDPYSENLTADQRKAIVGAQAKVRAGGLEDTTTKRAMQLLMQGGQLTSAGLDPKEDKEGYNQFTGNVHAEIQDFKASHNGRAPNPDEIQTIGRRLLSDQAVKTWHDSLWQGTEKLYRMTAPEEEAVAIRRQAGRDLSDDEVNTFYRRHQYNLLVKKETARAR